MVKCQFHWWRKPEHPEETTDLRQVTDKLSHIWPVPSPRIELGPQRCEARWSKGVMRLAQFILARRPPCGTDIVGYPVQTAPHNPRASGQDSASRICPATSCARSFLMRALFPHARALSSCARSFRYWSASQKWIWTFSALRLACCPFGWKVELGKGNVVHQWRNRFGNILIFIIVVYPNNYRNLREVRSIG